MMLGKKAGGTKWGLLGLCLAHGSYIQSGKRISLTVKFNLKIQILCSPFSLSATFIILPFLLLFLFNFPEG